MAAGPCATCAARERVTVVRDFHVPGRTADATLGLREVGDGAFVCAACGTRYRRTVDCVRESDPHDAWSFTRLPTFGCDLCGGDDAAGAWDAGRTRHLHSLVDESHFDVAITACACGQAFVRVFTERIDWVNSEDDQTSTLLPVRADEVEQLRTSPSDGLEDLIMRLGASRRFVLHRYPSGGVLTTTWRDGGFWIDSHD